MNNTGINDMSEYITEYISKVGESTIAHNGQKMTIIGDYGLSNIEVEFEEHGLKKILANHPAVSKGDK